MSWIGSPAGRRPPASWHVTRLDVADHGVDLPQPVAARIDLHVDAAAVLELALGRGGRQGHGSGTVEVGL